MSRACARLGGSVAAIALVGCGADQPGADAGSPTGPRVEPADERALIELSDWRKLPELGAGTYRQLSSQDRETGEPPLMTLLKNANRDMNNFVCKSDDAVVSTAQIIPFHFDEPRCAEDWVHGVVLARFEGTGRLARFWMTESSIRKGNLPDEEVFRIYVDDETAPIVEAPLAQILDGTAGEIFAPPFGAGPGDHVAWYYPVVFSSRLVVALDHLGPGDLYYHQTSVVLDPDGSNRRAASARLAQRDLARATLLATETGPVSDAAELLGEQSVNLLAGAELTVAELAGPATIHELRLAVRENELASLADVDLSVSWDGASQAAIAVPLAELFAAALARPDGKSLALSGSVEGSDAVLSLRLPMPFAQSATFRATSHRATATSFRVAMRGETSVPEAAWGSLHVERNETVAPAPGPVHPLANVSGRGRWVGTCMMMQGHGLGDGTALDDPLNFLEGDERVLLDTATASVGTGTEDYYNGAFYFEAGPRASPFAQWWGVSDDGVAGRASACRFHVLTDAVDFQQSAEITIEIGPSDPNMLARYRSLTFFYLGA